MGNSVLQTTGSRGSRGMTTVGIWSLFQLVSVMTMLLWTLKGQGTLYQAQTPSFVVSKQANQIGRGVNLIPRHLEIPAPSSCPKRNVFRAGCSAQYAEGSTRARFIHLCPATLCCPGMFTHSAVVWLVQTSEHISLSITSHSYIILAIREVYKTHPFIQVTWFKSTQHCSATDFFRSPLDKSKVHTAANPHYVKVAYGCIYMEFHTPVAANYHTRHWPEKGHWDRRRHRVINGWPVVLYFSSYRRQFIHKSE